MQNAKVRLGSDEAEFDTSKIEWESSSPSLRALLNSTLPPLGFTGAEPDPAFAALQIAREEIPELVVLHVPPPDLANQRRDVVY